ncbi:probable UDP-sugar transporter protein SLC35A4 [Lingula anatina]|uniref:Probable UDP-sugar transporter protein SLC35A4 n=1 Tax=Lingula anatina TaxID=7574 RepID=A0A1S3JNW0_LINAN|nr:probable UDP-sugar transporter protein SLC35A4 [Lingula anatina]|eukprot:XP_013411669.1 probable UDP-sugar transporter protein SLC35A4 [Lingula anatina]
MDSSGATHSRRPLSMEREKVGSGSAILYCGAFLLSAVGKLYTLYAMKYYNNNIYPLPATTLVAWAEVLKLITMVTIMLLQGNLFQTRFSVYFALPAVLYGSTNNINVYALHYTSPPVWAVLIQMRLIFAALTYRWIFKRSITKIQWLALVLLIGGIVVTKSTGDTLKGNYIHPAAIALAAIKSLLCVAAAILTEFLFKNDHRSFIEQQMQLYFFGAVVTSCFSAVELRTSSTSWPLFHASTHGTAVVFLLVLYLLFSVITGCVVAIVIKKLDNIVKLYVGVLSILITTFISSVFFSGVFKISAQFVVGFLLVCEAIFLYEKPSL